MSPPDIPPATNPGTDTSNDYHIVAVPSGKRVRVTFAGETIADSADALVLHETRLPPVYYFPKNDVRMEFLKRTELVTHCPFKGNASYWTIETSDKMRYGVTRPRWMTHQRFRACLPLPGMPWRPGMKMKNRSWSKHRMQANPG
jgi:uncharacterized protein (DUF427 family)